MACCSNFARHTGILTSVLAVGGLLLLISDRPSAADTEGKLLRHVVMFKFKDSSSPAQIQEVIDAFRGLPKKIPNIAGFEYGTDNSPEGLANGFTHCFLLTFKSEKDREIYLPHEAHKAFGAVLKPHLDKVMVIDYWTEQ